ncbi:hypothetical protein PIB30_021796 [Stylosanthes scabra]|uniref:Uncharacterized protein n=1 Tax=Stylosanthes scabra TaxID=79078 RepID=A0ABU6W6Y1_9FABA|nr:hypothetical protein [Stylosanthes scabra]
MQLIERDSGSARLRHKNTGLSGGCICGSETPRQAAAAMESDETCHRMEDGAALAVSTGWRRGNLLCLALGPSKLQGKFGCNFDSQEDIAYPNDTKVPIKVDDDLKQLFRSIKLPRDMIVIEESSKE